MKHNFFYQPGLDISNPKACFEYINRHYRYDTMNSWNRMKSIANKVKVYDLNLDGDAWTALKFLEDDDYFEVNEMIHEWEASHNYYKVGFNGRSGGYLVLYNASNMKSVIPDEFDYNSWEDLKADFKDHGDRICDYAAELRELACTVRDFDKLCDDLREYVNNLSTCNFNTSKVSEMVQQFNDDYGDDINILSESLSVSELRSEDGCRVDLNNISESAALMAAWWTVVNQHKLVCGIDYKYNNFIFEMI